jgi:hypothetical protein
MLKNKQKTLMHHQRTQRVRRLYSRKKTRKSRRIEFFKQLAARGS